MKNVTLLCVQHDLIPSRPIHPKKNSSLIALSRLRNLIISSSLLLLSFQGSAQLQANFQVQAPTYPCSNNGQICFIDMGSQKGSNYTPVPPYQFTILDPTGNFTYDETTQCFTSLASGTYQVHIQDSAGGEGTETLVVPPSPIDALSFSVEISPDIDGAANGSACATVTGGTGQYTYTWISNSTLAQLATTLCISGLSTGHYTFTIYDSGMPCFSLGDVYIPESLTSNTDNLKDIPALELWPNPSSDKVVLLSPKTIQTVNVLDMNGAVVATHSPKSMQFELDLSQLPVGLYIVRATAQNGDFSYQKLVISR
jgi:uncharacterized protein (DUF2141 family)